MIKILRYEAFYCIQHFFNVFALRVIRLSERMQEIKQTQNKKRLYYLTNNILIFVHIMLPKCFSKKQNPFSLDFFLFALSLIVVALSTTQLKKTNAMSVVIHFINTVCVQKKKPMTLNLYKSKFDISDPE